MTYRLPGLADELPDDLVQRWNRTILAAYEDQRSLHSRFFTIEPDELANPVPAAVKWFADPLEPAHCVGPDLAQRLCDHGLLGRHQLHNEYCEYRVVSRVDGQGRIRPKRVEVTTELREYWLLIARHDPHAVQRIAAQVLGFEPPMRHLYGVDDPSALSPAQREREFARLVAGHGNDPALTNAGVPVQPTGPLNTEHLLFMTHPINGLDDLVFIVLFGAHPYAHRTPDGFTPAGLDAIFANRSSDQLFCRHADPAAAAGAHGAAFGGRAVAFSDPLGMYLQTFTSEVFRLGGEPLPESWIRLSRGREGAWQRLEFGPPDDEPTFLDDLTDVSGAEDIPVRGGYQILQQIEVGPLVAAGDPTPVAADEFDVVPALDEPIACGARDACQHVRRVLDDLERVEPLVRIGPRRMGAPEARSATPIPEG